MHEPFETAIADRRCNLGLDSTFKVENIEGAVLAFKYHVLLQPSTDLRF